MVRRRKKRSPTAESDNSSIDVSESTNVAIIKGGREHTIIQHFQAEEKPIEVLPYSDDDDLLIRIGKWLMRRLFDTTKHDMRLFTVVISLFGVVSGTVTFLPFVPNSPYTVNSPNFVVVELTAILALAVVFYLFAIIRASQQTQCPKCGTRFSLTRKSRILKNTRNLQEKEVRNYESTFSCDNLSCNYKRENVSEVEEIPITPNEEE